VTHDVTDSDPEKSAMHALQRDGLVGSRRQLQRLVHMFPYDPLGWNALVSLSLVAPDSGHVVVRDAGAISGGANHHGLSTGGFGSGGAGSLEQRLACRALVGALGNTNSDTRNKAMRAASALIHLAPWRKDNWTIGAVVAAAAQSTTPQTLAPSAATSLLAQLNSPSSNTEPPSVSPPLCLLQPSPGVSEAATKALTGGTDDKHAALEAAKAAWRQDPTSCRAAHAVASCYLAPPSPSVPGAVAVLQGAARMQDTLGNGAMSAALTCRAAALLISVKSYKPAAELLAGAIKADPNAPMPHLLKGALLNAQNKAGPARAAWSAAARLDPSGQCVPAVAAIAASRTDSAS